MKKPLVSVVIVSYNTRDLTVKSIKHVKKSKGFAKGDIEIIVVDNNSSDDTVQYLKKHNKEITLISNNKNRGFGGGNNQGVTRAKGKYILLLNTDAFLSPDTLKTLVDIMEERNDIISVGPQLRYEDGRVQLSGGYLPTPIRVLAWMWWLDKLPLLKEIIKPYHVYSIPWHQKDQYPEWLMGACVLFRRAEFTKAGGFDEKIFMYAEEVELYRRLKQSLGKKVFFTPKTQVIHIGSASTKKANTFRLVHELKGVEYIYQKHYPRLLPLIKLIIYSGSLMRLVLYRLLPGRREAYEEYKKFFQMA